MTRRKTGCCEPRRNKRQEGRHLAAVWLKAKRLQWTAFLSSFSLAIDGHATHLRPFTQLGKNEIKMAANCSDNPIVTPWLPARPLATIFKIKFKYVDLVLSILIGRIFCYKYWTGHHGLFWGAAPCTATLQVIRFSYSDQQDGG